MTPLSIVIVGSGYRAILFAKVIQRFPEHFHLEYLLCRGQEKADKIAEEGIPTTISKEECRRVGPDFVMVAVNKENIFSVAEEWIRYGVPVLLETPAAATVDELKRLWELNQNHGARIQVAEQYRRYPSMAAGLRMLKEGKAGDPYAVSLSLAHDYHAAGLIRGMLNIGLEPMSLRGKRYRFPVTQTNSRYGPITDGSVKEFERDVVTIEFASGKAAFYDFCGVQYRTFIRARHVNVQGRDGEWNDTVFRYVGENHLPVQEYLCPYLAPEYRSLETEELKEICGSWNPFLLMEEEQDRYAIATMLYDMRRYLEDGTEIYPLREGLEDAYTWLLIQEAVTNPGKEIKSEKMPWQETQPIGLIGEKVQRDGKYKTKQ